MPLSIHDVLSRSGATGAAQPSGAPGISPGGNGSPASAGGPGAAIMLGVANRSLLGDQGGDQVTISRSAAGGTGGSTGIGGSGANGVVVSDVTEMTPKVSTQTVAFGTAGDGAAGGDGGDGGRADARIWNLTVDLAGGATAQNGLTLHLTAQGGNGAPGNSGGAGGSTGTDTSWAIENTPPPDFLYFVTAPPGGAGGAGGAGGDGGEARAVHNGVTVRGENILLRIDATATGGAGREGGTGGTGGNGGGIEGGGAGGRGGDGGDGGLALARVFGLDVEATQALNLTMILRADGGDGGAGGVGGTAGTGGTSDRLVQFGLTVQANGSFPGDPGTGGDGGDGGDATARLLDSRILGSDGNDSVTLRMTAEGGAGGLGGAGGPGFESSTTAETIPGGTSQNFFAGTPPGAPGTAGMHGEALVLMRGVTIELGGGADTLRLELLATGPGANRVTVAESRFDGGGGVDEIILGSGSTAEPAVFVDVAAGTLRFERPGAPANVLTGFEQFGGGSGDDRFRDGAGDHVYRGGGGDDLFVFFARFAGHDRVLDLGEGDVIGLRGFGARLDSFAEVLAAATDVSGGVLVTTGAASSILIGGQSVASLAADMFAF